MAWFFLRICEKSFIKVSKPFLLKKTTFLSETKIISVFNCIVASTSSIPKKELVLLPSKKPCGEKVAIEFLSTALIESP